MKDLAALAQQFQANRVIGGMVRDRVGGCHGLVKAIIV